MIDFSCHIESRQGAKMDLIGAVDTLTMVCHTVVSELVDYPDHVLITSTVGDGASTAVITIRAQKSDYGKVIGRHGRNVEALRTLMEAIATKHKIRLLIEIDDKRK